MPTPPPPSPVAAPPAAALAALPAWAESLPLAITVCDRAGVVVAMNARAAETFARDGGRGLVGRSLFSCHPERASAVIRRLLAEGGSNSYTIEKKGVKKLIHQAPWCEHGEVAGLVELSLVLPADLPHFVRQG